MESQQSAFIGLLGRTQPVIPPNLYVNEHNSLGSSGNYWSAGDSDAKVKSFAKTFEFMPIMSHVARYVAELVHN